MTKNPSLAETHPELATQANGWDPSTLTPGSKKQRTWICVIGHTWEAAVQKRTKGQGCPFCGNRRILRGFNDLRTTNYELSQEWHPTRNPGISPEDFVAGSGQRVWWLCQLGHEWQTTIDHRSSGQGCPFCARKAVWPGFNDLGTLFPDLVLEWDVEKNKPVLRSEIGPGSDFRAWWKCSEGHEYLATPAGRVRGRGCSVCAGKLVQQGVNDLETRNPNLAGQWHPTKNKNLLPSSVSEGSDRKVWWICPLLHEWRATIGSRTRGCGCPVCAGNQVLTGFNDIKTRHPALFAEWDFRKNSKLNPKRLSSGSHVIAWWRCVHGHSYRSSISNRVKGRGCSKCRYVEPGVNDLATNFPRLVAEFDQVRNTKNPTEIASGSSEKIWWKCKKGHSWQSSPANRKYGRGCPSCAIYGFKPEQPATLYLLENFELSAFKFGITNVGTNRLQKFKDRGWNICGSISHSDGALIYSLEQRLLAWVRLDLLMPPHLTENSMGTLGGWTETFTNQRIGKFELMAKAESLLLVALD